MSISADFTNAQAADRFIEQAKSAVHYSYLDNVMRDDATARREIERLMTKIVAMQYAIADGYTGNVLAKIAHY